MSTPIFHFGKNSIYRNIVIKREDLSETGSHKFRYLKKQLKLLKEQGKNAVVLSTTGNAGITASFYGKQLGIKVFCLMSVKGDMNRAAEIDRQGGFLIVTPRPMRFAKYLSKKYKAPLLRASQDEFAVEHYQSLGEEILEQVPDAEAIVNFCTSGTSSLGLMQVYKNRSLKLPALHLVCLHEDVVKNPARRKMLNNIIHQSNGKVWRLSAEELKKAEDLLKSLGLETSWEGVSSFAVAEKIKDQYQSIIVIFSGKKWPETIFKPSRRAETIQDMDRFWEEFMR